MLKIYLNKDIIKVDLRSSNKKVLVYRKIAIVSKKWKTITSLLKLKLKVVL